MNLFRKAGSGKPTTKDAIIRLRESLETLEKREKYLQIKVNNELKIAKENAHSNKTLALMALKRKRAYEDQITKIMGSRMTIEQQVLAIENASLNLETMNAMKAGADAMKNIHGKLDINKVDSTMDDIREQMDLANEVSDAISQPVGIGIDFDEDELEQELNLLGETEDFLGESSISTSTSTRITNTTISNANIISQKQQSVTPKLNTHEQLAAAPIPPRNESKQIISEEDDDEAELNALKATMAV